MKKPHFPLLLLLTLAIVCFTLGFFLGRSGRRDDVILSLPASLQTAPTMASTPDSAATVADNAINLNTATAEELMTLPGIGEVYAQRILDYRKRHGGFSSVDELLNIPGIGEKRLEEILDHITIGG